MHCEARTCLIDQLQMATDRHVVIVGRACPAIAVTGSAYGWPDFRVGVLARLPGSTVAVRTLACQFCVAR